VFECGNPVELNANLKKIVGGVDADQSSTGRGRRL
jgi:hypothetical protein